MSDGAVGGGAGWVGRGRRGGLSARWLIVWYLYGSSRSCYR